MFDAYRVDANGKPTTLKRTLNTFYGDVSVHETFTFSNANPKRTSVTVLDLSTRKPVDIKTRDFTAADVPIRRSLPFPKQMAVAKNFCEAVKP